MSGCIPTYQCSCSCHQGGPKYMRASNPPQPCCDCSNFNEVKEKPIKHESSCKCIFCLYQIIDKLEKRIRDLESIFRDFPKIYAKCDLDERISKIERVFNKVLDYGMPVGLSSQQKSYTCTVCSGLGKVYILGINDQIQKNSQMQECMQCHGTGKVYAS